MTPPRAPKHPLIQISDNLQNLEVAEAEVNKLVKQVLHSENISAHGIHVIFVDDEYLRRLHKEYLDDNTPTDVMTFDLSDDDGVDGEIYISLDRAKAHAIQLNVTLDSEIARLIIHGLLHLKGYDDSTQSEREEMRKREDQYLNKYLSRILL
jgi:probable rRNA maturation factor